MINRSGDREMSRRALVATALVMALVLLADEDGKEERKGLIIIQESNGLIGGKRQTRTQKLLIRGDKMKLVDEDAGIEAIVRLDKKLIWEIDRRKRRYVETHFSYFEQLREEREKNRLNTIRGLNERCPPLQRKDIAAKLGYLIGENGKVKEEITAELLKPNETKEISGYKCRHYILKEDLRVVLDVWTTDEIEVPDSVIRFYRESGMLSEEVERKLNEVKGFPVKLELHLDLGTVEVAVTAMAKKIEEKEIDDKEFELPEGLKLEKVRKRSPQGERLYKCSNCGREFESEPDKVLSMPYRGKVYRFCSKKCRDEFIKKLREGRK